MTPVDILPMQSLPSGPVASVRLPTSFFKSLGGSCRDRLAHGSAYLQTPAPPRHCQALSQRRSWVSSPETNLPSRPLGPLIGSQASKGFEMPSGLLFLLAQNKSTSSSPRAQISVSCSSGGALKLYPNLSKTPRIKWERPKK